MSPIGRPGAWTCAVGPEDDRGVQQLPQRPRCRLTLTMAQVVLRKAFQEEQMNITADPFESA
jgi:hypothetical protein